MNDEVGADNRSVKYISASSGFSSWDISTSNAGFHQTHLLFFCLKDHLGLLRSRIEPLPRPVLDL
jgi:hypothetical protein